MKEDYEKAQKRGQCEERYNLGFNNNIMIFHWFSLGLYLKAFAQTQLKNMERRILCGGSGTYCSKCSYIKINSVIEI